jgi:hypothetical protein
MVGDWRCSSERGIELSNINQVLMAEGIPIVWGIFSLYWESLSLYQIFNPGFGLEISEISIRFNHEQFGPSKLMGNLEDKDPMVRRWPWDTIIHAVVDERGGSSEWVPMQCNQPEKPLLWHHSCLTTLETWGGWGSSWLTCCYSRPGKKEEEPEGNFPCHVEKTALLNCDSGNWTGSSQAHSKSQHKRISRDYSSQLA